MSQSRFFLLLLGGALLGASACPAGLTLLQRETFQGVGTLNAANPGSLGAVNDGAFYKRPVGPRVAGDTGAQGRGWSADMQGQFRADHAPSSAAAFPNTAYNATDGVFAFDWWVYLEQPASDGANGQRLLSLFSPASGQTLLALDTAAADGLTLIYEGNAAGGANTARALVLRQWTNFRVVWTKRTGGYYQFDVSLLVRVPGGAWMPLVEAANVSVYGNAALTAGFSNLGSQPRVRGRYGMPSLYRLDVWADRTLSVPDVADPPAGPFAWYVNPATGSDGNDGTTPATAWATAGKVNAESANLGMIGRAGAAGLNGDTLTIDTRAANLVLGPQSLNLATAGLNVVQLGGGPAGAGEIQAWGALAPGSWSLVVGNGLGAISTGIFQQTLSEANPACVLWENGQWLNHPTGADFAAVQPALQSTPGSFWTDGTTLYVHPFGDTNPARDGKAYTRSYNRLDPFGYGGMAAVQLLAPDLRLSGLRVRRTCLADMNTNDPVAAYCYQTAGGAGGATLLENCYGDYGGKHVFGFTDNSVTRRYTVRGCQGEQATPYVGFGGQTVWVDFGGGSGSGTATTLYDHCVTNRNAGQVGSAAGQVNAAYPAWISHGDGPVYQEIDFVDCALAGPLLSYGGIGAVRVTGGSNGGGSFTGGAAFYEGVAVYGPPPTANAPGTSVSVRDCVVLPPTLGGNAQGIRGTVAVEGCTVDCRAAAADGPLYARTGALNLTWRNNLLLGTGCPVLSGALNTDALAFDHNAYEPGAGAILAAYGDGATTGDRTLAQWQALGFDAGSFAALATLSVDVNLEPKPRSPLIHAGANLGPGPDFTGRVFPQRDAIGAYQPPPSAFADWQALYFSAAQGANPAVGGPAAAPAGDGVANLLKYAYGLAPLVPAPAVALPAVAVSPAALTLTFNRSDFAADLQYRVESSPDLRTWTAVGPALAVLSDDGQVQRVSAQVPLAGSARQFLRLRVVRGN